jgi:hypothetical protein
MQIYFPAIRLDRRFSSIHWSKVQSITRIRLFCEEDIPYESELKTLLASCNGMISLAFGRNLFMKELTDETIQTFEDS